jgi:hypothetical protein
MTLRRSLVAFPLLAAACASAPRTFLVDGREVPRPTLEYHGQPYRIRHSRAYPHPGSPSSGLTDAGGDIDGRVCGTSVDYVVKHQGYHVLLSGSIDGPIESDIDIREDGQARTFDGKLGGMTVSLQLRADGLSGHVGKRQVELRATDGDLYVGILHIEDGPTVPIEVHGVQAMNDLPAADQGAILPTLLICGLSAGEVAGKLIVGFGGQATESETQTVSLYTRSR